MQLNVIAIHGFCFLLKITFTFFALFFFFPIGADGFVAAYVQGKMLAGTVKVMTKLAEFDDSQAAMYLLRLSYGIVRANHFMRTTPLAQWDQVAVKFDDCVRETVAQILGTTFPGESYVQACVSTKIGGLGIRRATDHASGAFAASWHESMQTASEQWAALCRVLLCFGLKASPQPLWIVQPSMVLFPVLLPVMRSVFVVWMCRTPMPGFPRCLQLWIALIR